MESDSITIERAPRSCECCAAGADEVLWEYTHLTRTRTKAWCFEVCNVLCTSCGFTFVSPCPTQESLLEYYSDSFTSIVQQQQTYSTEKRIALVSHLVDEYLSDTNVFAEVGSNTATNFHSQLKKHFSEVLLADLNKSSERDCASIDDISVSTVNLLAHYNVLEHIPTVSIFLERCAAILSDGGVMICEVPNLRKYPADIAALLVHEHTNHFSPNCLIRLAARVGLKYIPTPPEFCSRPSYAFVSCFQKVSTCIEHEYDQKEEVLRNRQAFLDGVARVKQFEQEMNTVDTHVRNSAAPAVYWGANEIFRRYLDVVGSIPEEAVAVDSNPAKKDFLLPLPVLEPTAAQNQIEESQSIVIFTSFNADAILGFVEKTFGKSYPSESIYVLDWNSAVL